MEPSDINGVIYCAIALSAVYVACLFVQPFRFPATFTFVVRSFTVLDGIGKGLNPRFDISEIAAPYARRYTPTKSLFNHPFPVDSLAHLRL